MNTVIVIPARLGSSRFPGKPASLILGKQLLHRTWLIAKKVKDVDEVLVATDDLSIRDLAESFGAKVIMTDSHCQNGTERVFSALGNLKAHPQIAINLQGDAVLTPPWVIQSLVHAIQKDPTIQVATAATQLDWQKYEDFRQSKKEGQTSGTTVVFDQQQNALYFSKAVIPFLREIDIQTPPVYRHIGLYAYRASYLAKYVSLQPTPLETAEKLEQLRFLENGIPIRIILVDYRGRTHWSVDHPNDIQKVEQIIKAEGELIE
jgi:3-deoxy-manno-octulosonate cytidylyltransferase (CMP-KDO synthetase)